MKHMNMRAYARPIAASVAIAALIGTLVGCRGPAPLSARPGNEGTASETTAAAPEIAGNYELCESLLSASTRDALTSAGLYSSGSSWEEKAIADEPVSVKYGGLSQARFADRGGVLCAWGPNPGAIGDLALIFGYGPISDCEIPSEKAALVSAGAKQISEDRYTDNEGFPGGYAFGNGYWAYVQELGAEQVIGSVDDGGALLDEIVSNAPAF
ncbi:hypothetical protein QT381_04080 [Galbitalea sp. SE-J8]|uniref:hypothetical protein n=1 Tax=Galbitalea sp. SE-J8 TaxID=3054952 RepID=UPI00259CC648|nr:hypothetical protein [Galbitalea sp. SE-J8]MDM4762182.1 hypothetical protein [Galbitalea sp. SE-J8]